MRPTQPSAPLLFWHSNEMSLEPQMARDQSRVVVGWKLDPSERAELLARIPPVYPGKIADHVTLAKVAPDTPLPDE